MDRWDLDEVQCMRIFDFDQINYLKIICFKPLDRYPRYVKKNK